MFHPHPKDFILIFLKAPRLGEVKTRLAKQVGADRALEVYRALVERQCQALPAHAQVEIHFTPNRSESTMRNWLSDQHAYYAQTDGDLGERLAYAVNAAFNRGARSVTCIGGDCPGLDSRQIETAQAWIHAGDPVVFGPSEDGGYYLISMGENHPELFTKIPWSQSDTLEVSQKKAAKLGLDVRLLEPLYDVDEAATLERAVKDGWIDQPKSH